MAVRILPLPVRQAIRVVLRALRRTLRIFRQARKYVNQYRQFDSHVGFLTTFVNVLALMRTNLLGYKGAINDLKFLTHRSPDAIEYLLNEFSPNQCDIEEFYKAHSISKTNVSFADVTHTPTWHNKDVLKVAGLARYLVLSQISENNIKAGLNLYGYLLRVSKNKVFQIRLVEPHLQHQRVFLDGLISIGAFDEWTTARNELSTKLKYFKSVKCDTENPFSGLVPGTTEAAWLKQFNEYFIPFGLQEIELNEQGSSPFDRLTTSKMPKVQGPLVSVVVSAFNSGPELISAVQSLLDQTWENIEVIIVDDCSAQTDYLDQAKEMDPRIKVFRQSENRGTYAARNLGIRNSNGVFVTTHDSDDWAHPQRIELQVKNLLENDRNLANLSWCIRVSSDLRVSTLGFSETRLNASSLMFRRSVIESIGYFDEVRKGADSEFRMRIGAHFPGSVAIIGFQPLSIIRIGHQSLSRSDFSPLWIHPNRHLYKQSYEAWHGTDMSLEHKNPVASEPYRLPFPSPIAFLNRADAQKPQDFDIVVAANFSNQFVPENLGLKYIKFFMQSGQPIAALNLAALKLSEPFDPEFQKLVSSGEIQCIPQDTVATVKELLVIDPEYLMLRSFLPQLLKVQKLEIKVSDLRVLLSRYEKFSGKRITLDDRQSLKKLIYRIQENAASFFDTTPTWLFELESDLVTINSLGIDGMDIEIEATNI